MCALCSHTCSACCSALCVRAVPTVVSASASEWVEDGPVRLVCGPRRDRRRWEVGSRRGRRPGTTATGCHHGDGARGGARRARTYA